MCTFSTPDHVRAMLRGIPGYTGFHLVDGGLVQHHLTILRKRETGMRDFYMNALALGEILARTVAGDLPTEGVEVTTPVGPFACGKQVSGNVTLVPVLSAAEVMVHPFIMAVPNADQVLHVGVYRDDADGSRPKLYKHWIDGPLDPRRTYVILDPMLATGGSTNFTIGVLKEHGAVHIVYAGVVAAPEGVRVVADCHPEVPIYTCALDEKLNKKKYIEPGLGDFGDRVWGRWKFALAA